MTIEPPSVLEKPMEVDPVTEVDGWGGLPPPGERPIVDRWQFILEVLAVFALWLVLWAVFRIGTVQLVRSSEIISAVLSIIMAPTLTLIPPIIWWQKRMKERGWPYLLTRRNLFSSVLVACLSVVLFFIVMNLSYPVMISAFGVEPQEDLQFFAAWRGQSLEWLVSITFLYMFIVGPVEELFHRGFIQDQINRAFPAYFGIFIASIVFVFGHLPIDVMVYQVTWLEWGIRWLSSFPFAIAMGAMYHWSRNIWGVAVYHGLYDWFLGISFLEYGSGETVLLTSGQILILIGVWSLMELVIIVGISYVFYRYLWKGDRPAGSLGFRVIGISYGASASSLLPRLYALFISRPIAKLARRIDASGFQKQEIWSAAIILLVLFGNLGFSGALGVVPMSSDTGGGVPGGGGPYEGDTITLPLETEHTFIYEGETLDYAFQQTTERKYVWVNVTLSWQDEADESARYTNLPDTLKLDVFIEDDIDLANIASDSSSVGSVDLRWQASEPMKGQAIIVSVTAVECGNQVPLVNFGGFRERADNGNSFDLAVELTVAA
jgi:membrane protease YdiL (CAAX protease family)